LAQIAPIQTKDVAKKQTSTPENATETIVKVDFDLQTAHQVKNLKYFPHLSNAQLF